MNIVPLEVTFGESEDVDQFTDITSDITGYAGILKLDIASLHVSVSNNFAPISLGYSDVGDNPDDPSYVRLWATGATGGAVGGSVVRQFRDANLHVPAGKLVWLSIHRIITTSECQVRGDLEYEVY